jgi:hypothetical protein
MGLVYEEDNSRSARLKRALQNPSKRTILIAVVILLAVASPFIMSTIDTAQEGIGSVTAEHDLAENMNLGPGDLDDAGIAPFLVSQSETMAGATSPIHWEVGNYRFGVCGEERVGEITDATYGAEIAASCELLYDIQGKYSRDCYIAATCEVKGSTKDELAAVATKLKAAHSTAGFTWPSP